LAKSAGNIFPAEFTQKSVGKVKSSSNSWTCYKESWSGAWASAQASWGVAPPLDVRFLHVINFADSKTSLNFADSKTSLELCQLFR